MRRWPSLIEILFRPVSAQPLAASPTHESDGSDLSICGLGRGSRATKARWIYRERIVGIAWMSRELPLSTILTASEGGNKGVGLRRPINNVYLWCIRLCRRRRTVHVAQAGLVTTHTYGPSNLLCRSTPRYHYRMRTKQRRQKRICLLGLFCHL